KLLAAIGAWVGWQLLPMVVLLSAGTGAIIGITMLITGRHKKGQPLPFGPYLAGGGWLGLLYGEDLQRLYFSMIFQ
ncbi:MAG: prepilin peptidase, partial [Gammaproteobacteria bacterium]|nr:prepilin peptidase [Gammaproteobacteria bacterium]NDG44859.1 prepilin peptidase [Gammaproteobacteria bacterium]